MKSGVWFIALEDREILGTLFIKVITKEKRAELKHLLVNENFRNKGIGKTLISKAIEIARKKQLRKITGFATSKYIAALSKLALYFGFKLEGTLKYHYRKNEDVYIYSLFMKK